MAIQAIDRKQSKHLTKVAKREIPVLVNRSNKRQIREISPMHIANAPRFGMSRFFCDLEYYNFREICSNIL